MVNKKTSHFSTPVPNCTSVPQRHRARTNTQKLQSARCKCDHYSKATSNNARFPFHHASLGKILFRRTFIAFRNFIVTSNGINQRTQEIHKSKASKCTASASECKSKTCANVREIIQSGQFI